MQEKKKLVNISIYIYTTYFGFLTKKKTNKKKTHKNQTIMTSGETEAYIS